MSVHTHVVLTLMSGQVQVTTLVVCGNGYFVTRRLFNLNNNHLTSVINIINRNAYIFICSFMICVHNTLEITSIHEKPGVNNFTVLDFYSFPLIYWLAYVFTFMLIIDGPV